MHAKDKLTELCALSNNPSAPESPPKQSIKMLHPKVEGERELLFTEEQRKGIISEEFDLACYPGFGISYNKVFFVLVL